MSKTYTEKDMDNAYDKGIMISKAAPKMLEALQNLENDNNQIPPNAWKLVQDAISLALNSETPQWIEEYTEVTPEMYKQLNTRKK
tara:strand:- start:377 stop:631 length:255 start_codon:yes stop_codon:yes gene_type:complete